MGLSRDTFHHYKNAAKEGGIEPLMDANQRKPNPNNHVDEQIKLAVIEYAGGIHTA